MTDRAGQKGQGSGPELDGGEQKQVEQRVTPSAAVVYEAIRIEGENELARPSAALFWSGLAAGLSMGFSLVAEGLLKHYLPDAPWQALVSKLGYSVGFLLVVLGRQQLFTENTLTVIIPLLTTRNLKTLAGVFRLWSVVLLSNLLGTLLFAWAVSYTTVFDPAIKESFARIGVHAINPHVATTLIRGVFAGWLIALMVWLLPVAETGRVAVIIIITYLVALGGFSHIIAGSTDVLFAVITGHARWSHYLAFLAPTLAGNVIGGVSLVAALNHAQVVAGEALPKRNHGR